MTPLQNTPEDLMAGRAIQPEILNAFSTISSLDQSTCEKVAHAISSLERIDGEAAFDAIVGLLTEIEESVRTVEAHASHLMNALLNTRPEQLTEVMQDFERWVSALSDRQKIFSAERLSRLRTNLDILTNDQHTIAVLKKSNELIRASGNELEGLRIVCDLRPVFDNTHTQIDSIAQVANLKIVYMTQVGDRQSFELSLTTGELRKMREIVDDALEKMELMEQLPLLRKGFSKGELADGR